MKRVPIYDRAPQERRMVVRVNGGGGGSRQTYESISGVAKGVSGAGERVAVPLNHMIIACCFFEEDDISYNTDNFKLE